MLVSHTHKFIYLKGGKVGGTSTEVFFQPACQPADIPITHQTDMIETEVGIVGMRGAMKTLEEKPRYYNHMPAAILRERLDREIWDTYFKFANVRNPYAAVLSAAMQLALQDKREIACDGDVIDQLDRLISLMENNSLIEMDNMGGGVFIDHKSVLDDTIRFEHLEDEIDRVAQRLNYSPPHPLKNLKFRQHYASGRKVCDFWTPELIARLLEQRGPYFDAFGYSKDPGDAEFQPDSGICASQSRRTLP